MKSSNPRRIVCCITSDPAYDQRMIRICGALQRAGYEVTLVGRLRPNSGALPEQPFEQVRLDMRMVDKGKLFYLVFTLKLFWFLLFYRTDAVCAIDLDTILPVYWVSRLRNKKRVYDAHELFTEMEEVVSRPATRSMWLRIEKATVRHFRYGYTVSESYSKEFKRRYGVHYSIVRNATVLKPLSGSNFRQGGYVLYQGTVNHGRCFEQLIPAMQFVDGRLVICGDGNFMQEARNLVRQHQLESKIEFTGYVPPKELPRYTQGAAVGITLFVATSLSNELSLANRFFDYMHAGVPQLAARYPEYEAINTEYEVALLIDSISPETISDALNRLLQDKEYHARLYQNCLKAREVYNWQAEEVRLLEVWKRVFQDA
jgi:glycosyltransferase involved in cell wall biosynthesis